MEIVRLKRALAKALRIILALTATMLLAAVVAWIAFPRHMQVSDDLAQLDISLNAYEIYDVGTVDFNDDGRLDVYTTNHSSLQSLLVAQPDGTYRDEFAERGLSQVTDIAGLEDVGAGPPTRAPGLYIFFIHSTLHFIHIVDTETGTISGSIASPLNVSVKRRDGFSIENRAGVAAGDDQLLRFSSEQNGKLEIAVTKSAPITIQLDPEIPLNTVKIGMNSANPQSHDIQILLKDRHGIAWSDQNADSVKDALIVRGALSGAIGELPLDLNDEYFLSNENGRYIEKSAANGFDKDNCSARQVAWVDVNNDGRLDIYIACGRKVGGFWEYVPRFLRSDDRAPPSPNLLFLQSVDGRFREAAGELDLDFGVGGTFLWLDVDNDADQDLLWASADEIALWRNNNGLFIKEMLLPGATAIQTRKLGAADFDNDGDLDVFAAATLGSKLFVNDAGTLRAMDPGDYGLPSRARTISWIDYDNDGLIDLHAWPGGVFRQSADHQFNATRQLRVPSPYWPFIDPRILWFDYDNDGDRDLITTQRFFPQALQSKFPELLPFTARFYRNDEQMSNGWIELDLVGPQYNREAIGASVSVTTTDSRQTQQVGQFETSHYSQGHYRLYFGLGTANGPAEIEIVWPDGSRRVLRQPVNNRVVRIEQAPDVGG